MRLRPYQVDLVERIKIEILKGSKSVCAVSGCGSGKSVIQGVISKSSTAKNNKVLFLVHRKELCQQITNTFEACGVNMELCDIMMVQTASRRLDRLGDYSLIITDECHHSLSATYMKIYERYPDVIRLGFTATPVRMNEGGLGKVYESIVIGPTTDFLIKNKYLAPYKYFSVELADAQKLNVRGGDYKKEQLSLLMEKNKIYGDTLTNWERIAKGKKTIIYCASVKSSIETANTFINNGYSAAHLDGTTPKSVREEVIRKFRTGEITVLSNNELFGEGLDIPSCECVVLLRPTKSLSLFIQQSMRSMRIDPDNPDKVAIIIDHVKNIYEHGFPDEEREWSLKQKKAKKKCEVPIKQCIKCYNVMSSVHRKCTFCGYEVVNEQRYEMEKVDMELKQLKRKDVLKDKHHSYVENLQTFSQLIEFQKAKGYKFQWCLHAAEKLNIEIPSKYKYMMNKFVKKKF